MTTLKLSEIRAIRNLIGDEWREVCREIAEGHTNISVAAGRQDWRFIRADEALDVLTEELRGDYYMLGCFKAEFLAECTGWPVKLIEAAQNGDAHEALGEAIGSAGHVREVAEKYARYDGFGHHFANYDGEEHEIGDWLAFRTN